jgi:hypothetical protein
MLRANRDKHVGWKGNAAATVEAAAARFVAELASSVDGGLELAFSHLRAALNPETLGLTVELLLGALSALRHNPPFGVWTAIPCLLTRSGPA